MYHTKVQSHNGTTHFMWSTNASVVSSSREGGRIEGQRPVLSDMRSHDSDLKKKRKGKRKEKRKEERKKEKDHSGT